MTVTTIVATSPASGPATPMSNSAFRLGIRPRIPFPSLIGTMGAVILWAFWGVIAIALAYAGPATPVRDDPVGPRRKAVGALTLVLGLLCFTPVPIEINPAWVGVGLL